MPERLLTRRQYLRASACLLAAPLFAMRARADEIEPPKFILEFGKQGKAPGDFDSPVGLAIDASDQLYVTDFLNKRVQKFRSDGSFVAAFPVAPYPGGLALDAEGFIYVAHWNDSKVAVYSPTGAPVREWGKKGNAGGEFQLTGGLAMSSAGILFVADQGNSRIQAFTKEGKFVRAWGSLGGGPGQFGIGRGAGSRFAGPQFLAVDRQDNIYATDAMSGRVQKFSPEGAFLLQWGSNAREPGGFGGRKDPPVEGPIALCVDARGRTWVGASNHRVQLFSPEGKYLCGFGGEGIAPGRFDTPHGMVVDSHGHLYVVDTMNCRVQKFAVPS